MVRKEIDVNKPLTDAQIAMLQALADRRTSQMQIARSLPRFSSRSLNA